MQVYGFLTKAQIENASADLTNTLPGLIWFNTTDNKVRFYDNGAIRSVVDEDTVQDVANKTFESGAISNFLDFTHNTTPANPAAGSIRVYPKADNKLYKLDSDGFEEEIGTGGGQAGINYIENWNAEKDLDGVSINGTIPLALETVDPLFGEKSFKVTGDGVTDFSGDIIEIDMLTVDGAIPGSIVSGEFWVRSQELNTGDMIVKIYDIDNAQYISLTEGMEIGASLLPSFTHSFAFQATDSLNYRVDVEIVDGSSAFEFVWDNIIVGPQKTRAIGAPVTNWETFTPTGTWTSNTTYTGFKRRVGDVAEYKVTLVLTGTPTATTLNINIPDGSIDTSKASALANDSTLGNASVFDSGTGYYAGRVDYINSTQVRVTSFTASARPQDITSTYPIIWANNDKIFLEFSVPIAGWSSGVTMSETTMNRAITFSGVVSSGNLTTSTTTIPYVSEVDTTNSYAAGIFTVPEDGNYRITANLGLNGTATAVDPVLGIQDDTSGSYAYVTAVQKYGNYTNFLTTSALKSYSKGDHIRIAGSVNTGTLAFFQPSWFTIEKTNTGSQTIAQSERVYLHVSDVSSLSVPSSTATTIPFATVNDDSHNAWSGGKFTAPRNGGYSVSGNILWQNASWAAGNIYQVTVTHKNTAGGVINTYNPQLKSVAATLNQWLSLQIAIANIQVNTGETLEVSVFHDNASAKILNASNFTDLFITSN